MIHLRSKYATRANATFAKQGAFGNSAILSLSLLQLPHRIVRMGLWSLVGMTIIWCALLLTIRPAAAQGFQLFVPSISTVGDDQGGSNDDEPIAECHLNENEAAIADSMAADEGQRRTNPTCDPILSQVARARARDMATRGYFSHTTPEGDGPNLLVRQEGYLLPDWYGDDQGSNNIESISAGYGSPAEAWTGWMNSTKHRTHILGTQQFYAEQTAFGVGYYYNANSVYKHYWVFLSAPLGE